MEIRAPLRARGRIRIAYLAHGIGGITDGVRAKILSQASAWAELYPAVDVGIFVRCESGAEADWNGQPHVVRIRSSRKGIAGRFLQRELLSLDLVRWRPDIVYLRQSTVSPSVAMLAAAIPTVVELNTLDLAELRLRSRARHLYALATRDLVLRSALGLVAVASEIAEHETVRRLGKPTAVVPNGVDLRAIPFLPAPSNPAPRVVFVGSPRLPWHGVDKILQMARHFPGWTFDVIGPAPGQLPSLPANVRAHGTMQPVDYRRILAQADVGIGPLALHRTQINEASPLKVAEYLACGLPAIIGYTDTRFPSGAPFLLQIPNREDGVEVSLEEINQFVLGWMGCRVPRELVASIDVRFVERRRVAFMLGALQSRAT